MLFAWLLGALERLSVPLMTCVRRADGSQPRHPARALGARAEMRVATFMAGYRQSLPRRPGEEAVACLLCVASARRRGWAEAEAGGSTLAWVAVLDAALWAAHWGTEQFSGPLKKLRR